jgi:hypothetical protein
MLQFLGILFGAGWTVVVSIALGALLLRKLSIRFKREEEIPLAFVIGAACLSLAVFVFCAAGLSYGAVYLIFGSAALVIAFYSGSFRRNTDTLPPLPAVWRRLFAAVFTIFGLLYLSQALAPEISPDGATYHLGLVGRYWRNHGFERITTNMYANLSQGVEMLYLVAYTFGRHSAAATVHFAFLAALPLMMLNYGRRFGFAGAGAAGALFFFVSPVVGKDGSTAYNDVAVACILFAVFYLLEVWGETRQARLLIPIGLLAGFAYAAKYTAFLAVPYALVFVFWKLLRSREPCLRPVVTVGVCAAVMMAPWLVKNWIWVDNPFSPFFNAVFPNPYIHPSFEASYTHYMRNYVGIESHWSLPLEVTVRGTILCGLTGPLFLLAPLALLALRHPHGRTLLLAALVFGATYATNIGTRFLIPALPYVSLALALAVSRYRGVALILVLAHSIASWPDVLRTYCQGSAWKIESVLWREALRVNGEEEFLRANLIGYATARQIEEAVPPGEKILSFGNIPEAYTTREMLITYQSAFNEVLGDILWTPLAAHLQPTRQMRFRFPPQELRKLRVTQTAAGGAENWSVAELRLYGGGREVVRDAGWRLRAHPNPWDVQSAFDSSAVTRWSSWQPLFDGMFIEVDLGSAQRVEEVVLECSPDQPNIRVRLEGADANGNWKTISDAPAAKEVRPPIGMRRAATLEIKNAGVRFLLVHDHDYGRDDFYKRQREWGLTLAGDTEGKRLYRIE